MADSTRKSGAVPLETPEKLAHHEQAFGVQQGRDVTRRAVVEFHAKLLVLAEIPEGGGEERLIA